MLLFLSLLTLGSTGQGIGFEQGKTWKQIIQKAKKSGRLIFVDCYTSWCGPCRVMTADVFPQDTVGAFFNRHLVNAKFDMEKEADGRMLRKKYRVESFPTLLFIDPETQEEVQRIVGQLGVNNLLQEAAIAIDPWNNTAGLAKRYAAGERTPEFLCSYQQALEKAMDPLNRQIAGEYLDRLQLEQLATEANWDKIVNYADDFLAKPLRLVMAHRERFYAIAGREAVDYKLQYALERAVKQLVDNPSDFDIQRGEALVEYLLAFDDAGAPGALACLYSLMCQRRGDFRGVSKHMHEAMEYNVFRKSAGQAYFNRFLPVFLECQDPVIIRGVIGLIGERCSKVVTWYEKADLIKLKALLQDRIGDTTGAGQSRSEEKVYRQQGDEAGEWM